MANFDPGVLTDRLQLALQQPVASHLWHQLYLSAAAAPAAARQALLASVRAHAPTGGPGGFLAATFRHAVSDDVADLAAASRAAVGSRLPVDAGLALLHLIYARALGSGGSADGYAALLRASGFLDVALHLGQTVAQRAGPEWRRSTTGHRPLQRVAVVTPTLSGALHAPTDMVLRHAGLLLQSGLEVSVFAAQEFQMLDMEHWLGVPTRMNIDSAQPDAWPQPRRALTIKLAAPALSMGARWNSLLQEIKRFEPDAVFFIGPYSPLIFALYQRYPLVGLGSNTLAPVGPLDVWLAPQAQSQATWAPHFAIGRNVVYSNRFNVKAAPQARSRALLGLPESAMLWVTTGTRLHHEISPAWRDAVLAALERKPDCHWLLVGVAQEQLGGWPAQHPRVHLRGFDDDLPSLLKDCSLYLNPPRLGGGHSVVCAMAHGLPVLALRGSDGGDKLGAWAQSDEQGYFVALDQLGADTAAQRQLGEHLRQRYLETLELSAGASTLLAALQDAAAGKAAP